MVKPKKIFCTLCSSSDIFREDEITYRCNICGYQIIISNDEKDINKILYE